MPSSKNPEISVHVSEIDNSLQLQIGKRFLTLVTERYALSTPVKFNSKAAQTNAANAIKKAIENYCGQIVIVRQLP